jgi:hypothetical protein
LVTEHREGCEYVSTRSAILQAPRRAATDVLAKRACTAQNQRRAALTITGLGRKALALGAGAAGSLAGGGIEHLSEAELQAPGTERLTVELDIQHDKPVMLFDGEQPSAAARRRARRTGDHRRH